MNIIWEALGVSLAVTLFSGPVVIPLLRRLKFGQQIRDDGPQRHLKKAGTPTMGGIMFLLGVVVAGLWLGNKSAEGMMLLGITLGFGLIGFLDDYIKVVLKRSLGLRAREKLLGQFVLAIILVWFAVFHFGRGTDLALPFSGTTFDFGWLFYFVFAVFLIVGMVNAVNLTDGLDGLAAGTSALVAFAYVVIAMTTGKPGIALIMAAVVGGCLGFLWYNNYPARVFMGDTGSLALGGSLAAAAVLTRSELIFLIVGIIFLVEALSVIIQVISFKLTGKRVFKMSPLHHHFELSNWSEVRIVLTFWLVTVIFAVFGLAGMAVDLSLLWD
ncbi:phospho-N-acetylmuramoyl-pentapeptide-transferas e [Desulfofarcimen acetoxidans DSM 771]|jgi:phospho-N-acetylmuramoyl-pentapeptide-transferase|uniref:Phospho-N-acetylmuramoyl-pentapeptide-transferase n=1 Tax=Desulfofarcimen acetoxidans (strain ATCC 49208 / DSM 771 / KCTC 5769 / VKM B-1644 / 5575) TaxID=485916 RepID=C8W470_DESAS|nr:phospho-N-acetylmuramoyl-pentapeptide-transferase [Desulfofarcimen acetoxidans]ACV61938.1 phospho-N-acetylmuramoyl-pentapeptide-transferas e [Desulfofarcimen acetoxidans DSM 771]